MNIVTTFDPSAATSGQFNAAFPNSQGKMVVYNESNISIQLQWAGFTTYCPAWTAMLYCVGTPNATINWEQLYILPVSGGAPISIVVIETFNDSEPILGTYPSALVRSTNIGNALNVAASVSSVANDGNTVQNVIEATLAGSTGSNLLFRNDGGVAIRQYVLTVLTTLFQITAGVGAGGSNVLISDALHQAEVLGNLLVDGGITSSGGLSVSGGGTGLDGGLWSTNGSGVETVVKTNFTLGSITRIKIAGPYTVTQAGGFVNHNLGVIPDFVSVMLAGTSGGGVFSCNVDIANATTSQVKLSSNSVSGITVYILSFKF